MLRSSIREFIASEAMHHLGVGVWADGLIGVVGVIGVIGLIGLIGVIGVVG